MYLYIVLCIKQELVKRKEDEKLRSRKLVLYLIGRRDRSSPSSSPAIDTHHDTKINNNYILSIYIPISEQLEYPSTCYGDNTKVPQYLSIYNLDIQRRLVRPLFVSSYDLSTPPHPYLLSAPVYLFPYQ